MVRKISDMRGVKTGVVLVLLGVIGAVVIPVIHEDRGYHRVEKARRGDLVSLSKSIDQYNNENGNYPSSLDDLLNGYVRFLPADPWGADYVYRPSANYYMLYSKGANIEDDGGLQDDVVLGRSSEYLCEFYELGCWSRSFMFAALLSLASAFLGSSMLVLCLVRVLFRRWKL